MKKVIVALSALLVISCANEPKDYVSISGNIIDQNSDSVVVRSRSYSKTIPVAADGTFSDTLKVETGIYNFYDGGESTSIFLKNGYDIKISLDTKEFDESIAFSGNGAENSTFLAEYSLLREEILDKPFDEMDKATFTKTFEEIETQLNDKISNATGIDTVVTNHSAKEITPMLNSYKGYFGGIIELKAELNGKPAPTFENFQNFDGSTTSLSDLKGKYVYVDVWATWCGPCKYEIPYLKEVEQKYHDKNIAFVSMSVDDEKRSGTMEKAEQDWKAMVADKELKGIQIMSPNGWKNDFVTGFKINGIPRFILIGPDGNTVDASAPRPSDERLITLFNKHNI
ncbi:TlpA family protein disulfide reductase [Urechidicola vernalis]|uniref:TlpA disulfide reductase family protein n=1 Tax=Urechidicola vernalis TaxID=3075600 RepID=A0ABU2Y3P4_9FLAO|nr:TlpA disulfide reductase family protein [Urechidicola sp. P050]MDT0552657.1 TlpA disulfide reductase family protein [Urechidicola sp. P050]